jgi:hypothetical protein
MTPNFTTPHEKMCFETAVKFNVVRGRGKSRYVKTCSTLEEAEQIARQFNDGRTMIYAINNLGNSAHIFNV